MVALVVTVKTIQTNNELVTSSKSFIIIMKRDESSFIFSFSFVLTDNVFADERTVNPFQHQLRRVKSQPFRR